MRAVRPLFAPRTDIVHHSHQTTFFPEITALPAAALFWRVGTGKTRTDLEDTAWQYCNGVIDAALVVAPPDVHRAWVEKQIPIWLQGAPVEIAGAQYRQQPPTVPDVLPWYYLSKQNATAAYWREQERVVLEHDGLVILAMYYEAFASQSGFEFAKRFVERYRGKVKITADESHRIKGPGSLASTRLAKLRDKTAVRRIMTATPTANGPEDLYAQFRFLSPDIIGATTFAEYKGMFVREVATSGNFRKIVGYQNIKYLNKRIAPYVFVAKKPEGLPPQFWNESLTTLSDEQRRHYDELRSEYQTQLRTGHWVEAELAITRLKRMQQIAAGHLPIPDPLNERKTREVVELDCPRIEDTIDVVRGCPEKVILWAQEHYEIERLHRELGKAGIGSVMYYGRIKDSGQRAANLRMFEEDRDIKVLVANDATGGTGLTIVGKVEPVSDMVFYSHTWSRILREQCEGRNHRPGTLAERCMYTDMVAAGSLDRKILARRKQKDDLAKLVEDPRLVALLLDPDLDYQTGGELDFARS